jgi:hypothetical protein
MADGDGRQHLVRVGQGLAGVTLAAVGDGRATVDWSGQAVVLTVDAHFADRGSDEARGTAGAPGTATGPRYDEFGAHIVLSEAQIDAYRRELPALMAQVRLAENRDEEGQVTGLRILDLPAGSVAASLGLMPGDVVLRVDDEPTVDARSAERMAGTILEDEPPFVDVVVLRGGTELELTYELE